jgi:hypothetical protein
MMTMKRIKTREFVNNTDHAEIYLKKNVLIKTVTFHEKG